MLEKVMPWLILWAASTTAVLVLFVRRLLVAHQQTGQLHIVEGEVEEHAQERIAKALVRIDLWGKTFTVVSVLLMVVIGSVWAWDAWQAAYKSSNYR